MNTKLSYEISWNGMTFEIPPCTGSRTFANCGDPLIHFIDHTDHKLEASTAATVVRTWTSLTLHEKLPANKWMDMLRLPLADVALTEDQILYFLKIGGTAFIPRENGYFITALKHGYALTEVVHDNCGLRCSAKEEQFVLKRYPLRCGFYLNDPHREHSTGTLLFLYNPSLFRL